MSLRRVEPHVRMTRRAWCAFLAMALPACVTAACAAPPGAGVTGCAWSYNSEPTSLPAFPDTDATYFRLDHLLGPQQSIEVTGTFPHARYLSFVTYRLDGNAVDSIHDAELTPEPGSDNPFVDPDGSDEAEQRRYRLTVGTGGAPTGTGANTLSAGSDPYSAGFLLMRIYVPDDPTSPVGSVERPSVAVREPDGSLTSIGPCAPTSGTPLTVSPIAAALTPAGPAAARPTFVREVGAGLFPNPDNAYLAARTWWAPGRVVVVSGIAPTTPDTRAGVSPATETQVRYWSLCTNTNVLPFPVVDCASDSDAVVDAAGAYTFVVSAPVDRPSTATPDHGVTWLSWGDTSLPGALILRNMLPAANFSESVQAVPPGHTPEAMGRYAPTVKYCATISFEQRGADC
jgi:hypothetical protein